jgi:hypothetical protein
MSSRFFCIAASVVLMFAFGASTVWGSIITISAWDTTGNVSSPAPADQPATASALNVTGLTMVRGPDLSASGLSNAFSSSGWNSTSGGEYFSFGFTVAAGYSVDLAQLIIATRSSATGPKNIGVFYSGDGYNSPLASFVQPSASWLNSIVDISALTGLTGTVEFRLRKLSETAANEGSIASGGTFAVGSHFANSTFTPTRFTGTVIPEPASLGLLGLTGLLVMWRRC